MRVRHPLQWMAASAILLALVEGPGCALIADIDAPATETCMNGKADQGELGVDCGGICRGACPGSVCSQNTDCASFLCKDGRCALPVCSDHVWNGAETDTDCGGANTSCPRCKAGQHCLADSDCEPLPCSDGVCASCLPCGAYIQKKSRPDPNTICDRSRFDNLVKCACGFGPCASVCGAICDKLHTADCVSCMQKSPPAGCSNVYNDCSAKK